MAEALAIVTAATTGATALSNAKPALWDPLMKKIASARDVKENLEALNELVGVLQSKSMDYENIVEKNKPKVPSESYKQWISRVKKIEDKVKELAAKHDKQSKISYLFQCLHPSIVKNMQKIAEQVAKLLEEGDKIEDILFVNPKLERVVKNREAPEIKKFETLQKPLEQILDLLKNDKVNGIKICGSLGIGKTTIMWNVNNHEEVSKMFDIVIWLKVSMEGSKENLSVEHLQQAIVRRLRIEMEATSSTEEVAETISMVLMGKKYLMLLDDVKEDINKHQIGIPDNENGSKFVMTTRLHHVCSSMVDRVIKVGYLSPDESWRMFQDVIQNPKLVNNSKIGPLAWRVCKECSGLPLLVEKVANTFKLKNNEYLWSDGLNSWKLWPEKECQGIIEMYKLLELCYDNLDDDRKKKCFLYSALYPEDSEICSDYLLKCWGAEDFLGSNRDASEVRLRMGLLVLIHLKDVSLLEEGNTENHVIMHKFIRQVALYISEDQPECKYLVKTSGSLQESPDAESWSEKNRISLGANDLDQLPDSPDCAMLSTLFLQKNLGLRIIPGPFFEQMTNLRVLDLSQTGIKLLPSSLSSLISLKVLNLNNCLCLVELPSHIAELVHLEALDIRGSGVNNIPPHIDKLTRLRSLQVSFATSANGNAMGKVIFYYSLISKLSRLEELVIDVKSPEDWSNEVVTNIIGEVAKLKHFKTLKFCFSNEVVAVIDKAPSTLRVYISDPTILLIFIQNSSWRNVQSIKSFQFFIGCQNSENPQIPDFVKYEKYVKYCNGGSSSLPILEILAEADAFELANQKKIKTLSDSGTACMNKVRGCLIESCEAIETIFGTSNNVLLPSLEHLYIKNLPELEKIWMGTMQLGSLAKLKTLVITNCRRLVVIFPPGVIQQLCGIQYLKIEDCQKIEEVISESDARNLYPLLQKLNKLILLNMPKLRSICAAESSKWPSLEKLKIFNCPNLLSLPFNKGNAKRLNVIKAERRWWEALQWKDQRVKEQIQEFCALRP